MYDVFTFSPDPILIVDASVDTIQLVDMNDSFSSWSGYRKDNLSGTSPSQWIDRSSEAADPFGQLAALSRSKAWSQACRFRSINGMFFEVRLEVLHIGSAAPEGERYAIVLHDISEQHWIDSVIREERAVGAAILTPDQLIQSLTSFVTPMRYDTTAFVQQSALHYISSNDLRHVKRSIEYASANRTPQPCSFHLLMNEQTFMTRALIKTFHHWHGGLKSIAFLLLQLEQRQEDLDPSFKLRLLMTAKNVSVTELARSTHISLTTISKIRNGKIKKPKRMTAELIAGELGVVPEEIWGAYNVSLGI